MANSVDPDQIAPIGAVCSGSTLFASILHSSVMLGNYLQQTTSADVIFQMHFFFLALEGLKAYIDYIRLHKVPDLNQIQRHFLLWFCTSGDPQYPKL